MLRSLNMLGSTLSALSGVMEEIFPTIQTKLLPDIYHHGLLSLPLEVVSNIFEHVHADDVDCTTQAIPRVNHYFRDIALKTPLLWTNLSTSRNPSLYIERSKTLGLHVEISLFRRSREIRDFLRITVPEANRWISLHIHPALYPQFHAYLVHIRESLLGKSMSALKVIRIERSNSLIRDNSLLGDNQAEISPAFHLYNDWSMPFLRTMEMVNIIPTAYPENLVCLDIHLCPYLNVNGQDIIRTFRSIKGVLQRLPALIELKVKLTKFKTTYFPYPPEAASPSE